MEKYRTIIETFGYSEQERNVFGYLEEYLSQIDKWLASNNISEDQIFRYMLIGVFTQYRAAVHQGEEFNTLLENWRNLNNRPKIRQKLILINQFYGKEIENTEEYLRLLGLERAGNITGKRLADFVIHGDKIG